MSGLGREPFSALDNDNLVKEESDEAWKGELSSHMLDKDTDQNKRGCLLSSTNSLTCFFSY
jgi:hypothetical protein